MISIIMPTFNRTAYLKQSIKSILNQTYSDIELIISCVHGDNKVIKIVDSFDDNRIKKVIANYACISYQKTLGFNFAIGEYSMFFGSDDFLLKDSLEKMYNFAIKNHADLVYPDFYIGNSKLKTKRIKKCGPHSLKRIMKCCYITDVSLLKKDVFNEYMPLLNRDGKKRVHRVWQQMTQDKRKIVHFEKPTFIYRQHDTNVHKKGKSQSNFKCVRVGHNVKMKKLYKDIPFRSSKCIKSNHFTLYFPDPRKFLKHINKFKFKKIIIHWDSESINNIDKFIELNFIYNITHDVKVFNTLTKLGFNNAYLIKNKEDLMNYVKEER